MMRLTQYINAFLVDQRGQCMVDRQLQHTKIRMEEVDEEPDYMVDRPKPQSQELEKLNLVREEEDPRPIFIFERSQ